jgi:hypothetical protein
MDAGPTGRRFPGEFQMSRLKLVIALEVLLFGTASLVHAGILATGHEHRQAATAEGVIALVLLLGLIFSTMPSLPARALLLSVQIFALLGTLVGAFTIVIGIGPQTAGDIVFHGLLLIVLVIGLIIALQPKA